MILRGDIDEIRYRNEENGYTIAVLDVGGEPVVATGNFPPLVEGQSVALEGEYVVHRKYGKQFKTDKCEIQRPSGLDGMVRYLGSGLIYGIGPALALRIVSMFGENTFSVIENNTAELAKVKGISKAKAKEITAAYSQIKEMQEAVMTLQSLDVPLGTAVKIYENYGTNTVAIVSQNPYRLIEDVDGIGFITADRIAIKSGVPRDSVFRVAAGIIHVLKESVSHGGNTCYPKTEAIDQAVQLLKLPLDLVERTTENLLLERRLRLATLDDEEMLVLPGVFAVEKNAAVLLTRLALTADATAYDVSSEVAEYERTEKIELHERQREAIRAACSRGVVLITGGPGTGKTTIIKCILAAFDNIGKSAILMAPTGRAAKRMSEATGREASTIHRACRMGTTLDMTNEELESDAVIVDEFSMVDIFLFEALLKKLRQGTRLILVGDKDQLPSVGAGNVLADIMRSGLIECIHLECIYRQAEQSLIVTNAHAVNRGEMPDLDDKTHDFFYAAATDPEKIAEKTVDMVLRAARYISVTPDRVQVLCPMKNGSAGAININKMLQSRLNPKSPSDPKINDEDYAYSVGDKVMHVVNNYDLTWTMATGYLLREGKGVFNGDIGEISEINQESGTMTVRFEDGRTAVYTRDIFSQLVLAYAITVHKSQGSEFDAVVIPVTSGGPMIMTRNLLYTAITRARRMVVIVGERGRIKYMVNNDYVAARYSLLAERIAAAEKDEKLLYGGDGS